MATDEKLLSYLKRVTAELHTLRKQGSRQAAEPLAVVGMACRLPGGVGGPGDLWELVASGRDAVSGFPRDRGWDLEGLFDPDPDRAGASYVSRGGFLDGAGLFDAGFFGISPREAVAMDPQQRLLLEVSWEALEDAGIDPGLLKGTDVGVFTGVFGLGYGAGGVAPESEGFAGTSGPSSVASGRVSYVFGFEGPAVSVDTACSSSLVAMHLAGQALRSGECSLALAGGASVMATPGAFVTFSRQRSLAPDGRCKSYSADADGTSWAEGVGVVVLERLSVAVERGHRVLAVVRGSAVNQDGASNGLTAPNGPSQQRVIRRALAGAGLVPADVDVVEGHGTGTVLGDPIEAQALLAAYGQGREPGRPLWLGSLKSNIGHAQAAAGVAGVIKMVQALRHQVMPPTLHVAEPTNEVDWSAGAVELLTQARDWPRNGHPRRAGVSSFGISGTNVHLILEEAPAAEVVPAAEVAPAAEVVPAGVVPLVVSARSEASLAGQAGRVAALLDGAGDVPLADVAGALVSGRAALADRAVVVAGSRDEALAGLGALARSENAASVVSGRAGGVGKVVWVFPGQGTQWAGMGRELLDSSPVFARRVAECEAALEPWIDWSLADVLRGDAEPEFMVRVEVLQPAIFAVMVGLAAVWASAGVVPDAVVGHSQGEVAAACVSGALSLEDAARVVAVRSRVLAAELAGRGGMASVALSEDEAAERLGPWAGRIEVAAVNSPSSVVIAGDAQAVDEAVERLAGEGVRVRRVASDCAGHTRQVDGVREVLARDLGEVRALAPAVPFFSTVTGDWVRDAGVLDGGYWYRNLRSQVRFGAAVADLIAQGYGVFVELSAHPVLVQPVTELADQAGAEVVVTGTLRRDDGGQRRLLASMAELFVRGVAVDWSSVLPAGAASARVDLPTYAFDHQHYWLRPVAAGDAVSLGQAAAGHPMLGAVVALPQSGGLVFTSRLSLRSHPWLADHVAGGVVVVPGTGLVELAVRAGDEAGCPVLEELVVEAPLVVPERGGVRVQVTVGGAGDEGSRVVEVYSQREDAAGADGWVRHAAGVLAAGGPGRSGSGSGFDFTAWPPPGAERADIAGGYELLERAGYGYGPAFRGVRAVWRRAGEVFAEVVLPEEQRKEAGRFGIHPALLDAALHAVLLAGGPGAAGEGEGGTGLLLPFAWNGLVLHAGGAPALRVRLTEGERGVVSLEAADEAGGLVVTLDSLVSRPVPAGQLAAAAAGAAGGSSLFGVKWVALPGVRGALPVPSWVPAGSAQEVAGLADEVLAGRGAPAAAVIEAVGGAGAGAALAVACRVLEVVQCWLAGAGLEGARLVVVTRGAVPAGGDGMVTDPAASAVWGLVRAAQTEAPDRIVLVDADPAAGPGSPAAGPLPASVLAAVLASAEPQIAVRGTALSVPRLAPATETDTVPRLFDRDGVVVVSGGGVLGAVVARHLVAVHGVRRLVVASRRGAGAAGAGGLAGDLGVLGAEVRVVACDVSDRGQVEGLLGLAAGWGRVSGVVHTAGVLDDGVIGGLSRGRLATVFGPKVDAVGWLDELTRGMDLDVFAVFSSAAGVFGSAGQGNYAAANAFLDGLMAARRAAGLPGLSLAWGLWEQASGMTGHLGGAEHARLGRGGVLALGSGEGMELFDAALLSGQALVVPVKLDLRALRADVAAGGVLPHVLRGLVAAGRAQARAGSGGGGGLAGRLAGLGSGEREALLVDLVRTQAAVVLGHAGPEGVRMDAAFRDAGFDSLTSVELRNRLREATSLNLPATLVFDYPTPLALARYLGQELGDPAAVPAAPAIVAADADEPLAVVGMACRLPGGVGGPGDLWELVASGRDAVSGFPRDRGWDLEGLFDPDPDRAGASYVSRGGFLDGAGLFDAGFFGISPREAVAMDPQQRLLLEVSWEALEDAGIDPGLLKGTDVGVFTGVFGLGYGAGGVAPESEGFAGIGASSSVASGRVSYVFGFEGPAVSVDTACSSSLVAMHLAGQALRSGECSLALAGGASVMATPGSFVEFSRQRGLAGDGRCKAFSDSADGMALSEGVGVVVLERLSAAVERGHKVLAVIRGSAVNQDGASNGLTAPNGPSQQRVIRRALAGAGLVPADVDVVEGHGTGTVLGDPIEAQALLAAYGQDRDQERPLWLGSLKSNIGHAQAAAGVAGVIKMVQALRHQVMPPTLHVAEPTTQVDWSAGAVELLAEAREWPRNGRPRRAGVSSFGISGTNVHLILEEAPDEDVRPVPAQDAPTFDGVMPLVVSARSAGSLTGQAGRLAAFVENGDGVPLANLAAALVSTRAVLAERAVVMAGSRDEAVACLGALARGEAAAGVVSGRAGAVGKVVWVFPGQGTQWAGMGRELLDSSPVFAERIAECAVALEPWIGWSLIEVLRGDADPGLMERVEVLQPATFAVMTGLAAVWESCGLRPDAVVGHSQGEIAAACVAGALSLQDAARVVALRSQAIAASLAGGGGMASVALSEGEAAERLVPWAGRVEVAAVNGPASVVIAGEAGALGEALGVLEGDGVRVRRVAVDYGSHTNQVEAIRDRLAQTLADVRALAPVIPFYSTVTGEQVRDAGVVDGGYWYRNLRSQVRFGPAVADLIARGHGVFLEVSPHPVLVQPISEIADDADVVVTGTLRRDDGGLRRLLTSMAELFVRGVAVDWNGVLPAGPVSAHVDLPTYAFDHQHYWLHPVPAADAPSLGLAGADHPMLGAVVQLPQSDGLVLTSLLSVRSHPWLADHAVGGVVILPGSGLVELAVRAGDEAGCPVLDELVMEAPLVLPGRGGVRVQVAVGGPDERGSRTVEVHSRRDDGTDAWTRHAAGVLSAAPSGPGSGFDFTAWPPPGAERADIAGGYEVLARAGYGYGPAFRGARAVWRRGGEVFAEVALQPEQREDAGRFGIHPALLDAALHAVMLDAGSGAAADVDSAGGRELLLPFVWNGLVLHAGGASALRVRVSEREGGAVSVEAADEGGGLVVTLDSLVSRPVAAGQLEAAGATTGGSLFGVKWAAVPAAGVAGPVPSWVAVGTAGDVATLADEVLSGRGAPAAAVMEAVGGGGADAALALSCGVLEVVQCWLAGSGLEESRLVVVTRGAVPAGGDGIVSDPAGSAVWGLVRAAQTEAPGRIVLVDADPAAGQVGPADPDAGLAAVPLPVSVLAAVLASGEPQVAVRGTALSIPRLAAATETAQGALRVPAGSPCWRLAATGGGTPESVALVPEPRAWAPLTAGQVRVGMRALGINFRDVLFTLGVELGGAELGSEGAGVVLEVGAGVTDLVPGDRVMGLTGAGFGSVTVTDRRYLVPMPAGWSFQQAASVPIAFLTAYYGLRDLADLRAGESVLVHAAAGGVGMAATQLARYLGAKVLGTASEGKWAVLRGLGFGEGEIASSRTAEFEERFLAQTSGAGVDVVLDCLAGELVDASLRLLPRGGRFLEMGKTDVREADVVASAHRGVSYRAFDLSEAGPDRVQQMLTELVALFDAGALSLLPCTAWDARRAPEAFRYMSQARHVGKIVLTVPRAFDADGVVVVSGGGVLGGLVARHLVVAHGVRRLVVASRRGAAGAGELAGELGVLGAEVRVVACDVSVRAQVEGLVGVAAGWGRLSGVVHTAGVLDDGVVGGLTPGRLATVFGPKVDAVGYLDELTRGMDLDVFVVFSSAAGVFGSAGQGNYAAANGFLDGLMAARRAAGRPGLSLAWGPWEQATGMTAHLGGVERARLGRGGVLALGSGEGMELFDAALASGQALAVPVKLDLRALRADAAAGGVVPHVLRGLVGSGRAQARAGARAGGGVGLAAWLAGVGAAEREALLVDLVRAQAAVVLGFGTNHHIDADQGLFEIGFDSLTAIELRNRLGVIAEKKLPPNLVFDYPTTGRLAAHLRELMSGAADGTPGSEHEPEGK